MRTTYITEAFDFQRALSAPQVPRRIVIHRQGNPGAEGENGLAWGKRTGAFTIHAYVDDAVCFKAIDPTRHAFHVLRPDIAADMGFTATGQYGKRGDYESIGIEIEDEDRQSGDLALGQTYGLSQHSRITALLVTRDYLLQFPHLDPDDVYEHATFDPATRAEDLGNALNVLDFRDDLRDLLAGRTPWRTVGRWATGARVTGYAPAAPAKALTYIVRAGDTLSGIAAAHGLTTARLLALNTSVTDANTIHVGSVLRLSDTATKAPPPASPATVTIAKSEHIKALNAIESGASSLRALAANATVAADALTEAARDLRAA